MNPPDRDTTRQALGQLHGRRSAGRTTTESQIIVEQAAEAWSRIAPDATGQWSDEVVKRTGRAMFDSMGTRSNVDIDRYPKDHQQRMRDSWNWDQSTEAVRSWFYINARAVLAEIVRLAEGGDDAD